MLARLFISGPLLYIGLIALIDPNGLAALLYRFASVLESFDGRIHAYQRREPLPDPEPLPVSRIVRNSLRIAGFVVAALAFVHLSGIFG